MYISRKLLFSLAASLLLVGCDSNTKTTGEEQGAQQTTRTQSMDSLLKATAGTDAFRNWSQYFTDQPSGVLLDSFSLQEGGTASLMERAVAKENMKMPGYERLYLYNHDSTKYIDIYSYSYIIEPEKNGKFIARRGEPDQEVTVTDRQSRKRIRIFFCGPACTVQNAIWYQEDVVGLFGMAQNEAGDYMPFLSFINIRNGDIKHYDYQGKPVNIPANHPKDLMKNAGIMLLD